MSWIETDDQDKDSAEQGGEYFSTDLFIVNIEGCLELEDFVVEGEDKLNVSTMSLSDLEYLTHSNDVLKQMVV